MNAPVVDLVETGTANTASLIAAFRRLGVDVRRVSRGEALRQAQAVVLPGVGTLGAAMTSLESGNLTSALREAWESGKPFLGICLGLQLCLEGSDESPGVAGLGFLPGRARRVAQRLSVPHMGWNRVTALSGAGIVQDGMAYFANSFALANPRNLSGFQVAESNYEEGFVAAISQEGRLLCQFHPELSGEWGEALLRRWVEVWR